MYTILSLENESYLSKVKFHGNTITEYSWNAGIISYIGWNNETMLDNCFVFQTKEEAQDCIRRFNAFFKDKENDYMIIKLKPKMVYEIILV